jgi:hypothetical protein
VFAVRQNLCCAFYFGRTAKSLFAVHFLYSARQRKNARQTSCLSCAWRKRTAKILFAVRFYYSARQSIFLPLRIPSNPNAILFKNTLPCALFSTHGKLMCLPCVFIIAHGKVFFTYFP